MKKIVGKDFVNLICGKLIGEGQYRKVFEFKQDETLVIKYAHEPKYNILEYLLWEKASFTDIGKWLAPIRWISPDCYWIIQARTQPIRPEELPKKIPAIFCDLKPENWGLLGGRPVCHDYGFSSAFDLARKEGKKLVNVNWRSGT